MREVIIEIPYPPTVNTYWRYVGGRPLISRKGREYRKSVGETLCLQRLETLEGELEVDIRLHPPDRRKRDVDNTSKAILDSLAHGGLFADDSQVRRLSIERCEVVSGGLAVVMVRELGA